MNQWSGFHKFGAMTLIALFTAGCGSFGSSGGDSNGPGGNNLTGACNGSDIRSISRPINPKDSSKGTFTYRAQIRQPQTKTSPVLVLIPGGPGQAWIGIKEEISALEAALPSEWGYMFTDPRGIGCNTVSKPDLSFYNSEYVAEDILAMIKSEGFENYILYGVSYGTLVGQIAASKAEQLDMPKAAAVVNEGTINKMFGSNYLQTYKDIWSETKSKMTSNVRSQFQNRQYPLKKTASEWTLFLRSLMTAGVYEVDGKFIPILDKIFAMLGTESKDNEDRVRKFFDSIVHSDEEDSGTSGGMDFYLHIACSEIWNPMTGMALDGETFKEGTADGCVDVVRTSSPYDSSKWKTTSPIYYFQGHKDPATPFAQARNQFAGQTSSIKRLFITAERGGHNPMRLSMNDCQKDIWIAAATGGDAMQNALQKCKLPGLSYEMYDGENYRGVTVVNIEDSTRYSTKFADTEKADQTELPRKKIFQLK